MDGRLHQENTKQLVRKARIEYVAERLRLLYVGITRARRDLYISFSERDKYDRQQSLALPIREWAQQASATVSQLRCDNTRHG